jgi:hypothetical protein
VLHSATPDIGVLELFGAGTNPAPIAGSPFTSGGIGPNAISVGD